MAKSAFWHARQSSTGPPSWRWCGRCVWLRRPKPAGLRRRMPLPQARNQSSIGETAVAGELILIVEDNEKNLKLVRDVLQFKGYRTLEAVTAEDGLKLAQANQPDLILMDIQLPGTDGITALRQLRSEARTAAIPVVALTAFAMKDDRHRFLDAGFDGYLDKPINIKTFPEQVRQIYERARK